MHLYIEQDTGLTENVSSSVIKKLYELAVGGTLDDTSDLKGTLHTTVIGAREKSYLEGMFSNLHITADEYSLTFDDPEMERICIANWGSNGVVTGNQLAAVTSLSYTFKDNTSIVSGDDFIYFTGLTGNGGNFTVSGCTNMTSFTIPPRMTEMPTVANCTSLTTITGLDHITSVPNNKFNGCKVLPSLTFTAISGNCQIGENLNNLSSLSVNEGCTYLDVTGNNAVMTTLTVPASVQRFNIRRFTALTTITFAQNSQLLSTNNYGGFAGCSGLTSIVNFPWDTWTTMGSYTFNGCNALTGTIKSPIGQTTILDNTFTDLRAIDTIVIDGAVTAIGNYNFNRCNTNGKVIMNPTTPPTLSHTVTGYNYGYANTTGIVFYVPDASYNDYISNGGQYWTELYNNGRIKKQSELPS